MIEIFNHAVAIGQYLVPQLHELIAAQLLFRGKYGKNFWPLAGFHKKFLKR
jgi:hypothetical protein